MRNHTQQIYARNVGRRTVDKVAVAWEKKAHRGRFWKTWESNNTYDRCGNIFAKESARVKRFREEAEEERQAGFQGQWQLESPAREYSEQVKFCLQ